MEYCTGSPIRGQNCNPMNLHTRIIIRKAIKHLYKKMGGNERNLRRAAKLSTLTGMFKDIRKFILQWQTCTQYNRSNCPRATIRKHETVPVPLTGYTDGFYRIIQKSSNNKIFILTALNALSHWVELVPLPNKEFHTIAKTFLDSVIFITNMYNEIY